MSASLALWSFPPQFTVKLQHFRFTWCEPLFSPSFHKPSSSVWVTSARVVVRVLSSVSREGAPPSCSTPWIHHPEDPVSCILSQLLPKHISQTLQLLCIFAFLPLQAYNLSSQVLGFDPGDWSGCWEGKEEGRFWKGQALFYETPASFEASALSSRRGKVYILTRRSGLLLQLNF